MKGGIRPVENAHDIEGSRGSNGHSSKDGSKDRRENAPRRRQQDNADAPGNRQRGENEEKVDPDTVEEEIKVKMARNPGNPTQEEVERHNMTHLPYRAWCPVCVEAKGKEDPHRKLEEKGDKPKVGLDYKSFGQEKVGNDRTTMIVGRDRDTRMTFCHVCLCKGPTDEWVVDRLQEDIDRLGHTEIILKTDGEPAIVALMDSIKVKRNHPTVPQHPPAYDPQSNGAIEKAVDDVMGQIRALKIGLERRIKTKVESDWRILQWMVEHAATLINCCQLGHDGRTPFRRLHGKESAHKLLEFGEQVMAKPKRSPETLRKRALKSKWVHGTWVGMTSNSNEHLVAVAEGGQPSK